MPSRFYAYGIFVKKFKGRFCDETGTFKKKEKIERFRKSLLKKKKNLHSGVALMQFFLHICLVLRREDAT